MQNFACVTSHLSEDLVASLDMYHLGDVHCFWFIYILVPESFSLRPAVHVGNSEPCREYN